MIKYKPEGYEDYLNMRELLDDLYVRLNMLEERIKESTRTLMAIFINETGRSFPNVDDQERI